MSKERSLANINCLLFLIVTVVLNGCAAMTQYTDWDKVNSDMNSLQQQYSQQSTKQQTAKYQTVQQGTQSMHPKQTTNNSERLQRENDAKKIENEGASLARQTSDYSKAQTIKMAANSLANRIRNGEITLVQAQSQLRSTQQQSSNQQQSIQVSGWYYTNPQYSNPTKTTVTLTIKKQQTNGVYPQYLILSIGGQNLSAALTATYERNTGLYVFTRGNTKYYFNM